MKNDKKDDDDDKRDKINKRELLNSVVEAAWRDGGALLEGATQEAVTRTVRGTIQVARHYATLIDQQKFNFGKYGKGNEVPITQSHSRIHTQSHSRAKAPSNSSHRHLSP